ncbi:MAG: hypothetical protein AAF593_11095 [Planctomycetota bacterium]
MSGDDVIDFYRRFNVSGIEVWIDGGWGVDALLGYQTRTHGDLDIVIQQHDVAAALEIIKAVGFSEITRDDSRAWNFVYGDDGGRLIDFHVVKFAAYGNGIYGPIENGDFYPAEAFTGKGEIRQHAVRCISVAYQVQSHTGYALREIDYQDMQRLHAAFGVSLPDGYE